MVPGRDAHGLHAQEHVAGDVDLADEVDLLVDEAQSPVQGILGRIDVDLFAIDKDLSFVGDIGPAQHLDQGALSGPVLAQKDVDLAGPQLEVDLVQRHDAWKLFCDVSHFDN